MAIATLRLAERNKMSDRLRVYSLPVAGLGATIAGAPGRSNPDAARAARHDAVGLKSVGFVDLAPLLPSFGAPKN